MPLRISKRQKIPLKKYQSKKRKQTLPTRLTNSRINYAVAKQVDKVMSRVSETKISAMTKFDEVLPSPIQLGAIAHMESYCIGAIPSVWSGISGLRTLTPFSFPKGDNSNQRNGDSIYLNKSTFSIELDTNTTLSGRGPAEFRVIAFKAVRSLTPTGISHDWSENLFLEIDGNYFGHTTSGINGTDLMTQPINKKYWNVISDKKFVISPVANTSIIAPAAHSSYYPTTRRLRFNCPWYKKVSFESDELGDTPENLDYRMCVVIYARPLGKDVVADFWETSVRGTTTYKDN